MQTGKINVQSENIFPIIKKFLYSDHEIFLRELISNAVDATQKLKTLASVGEFKGELGNTQIEVIADKNAKTLTVRDRGIGMTTDEIDKYINQIAFSGAEEFLNKYKNVSDASQMIGHFGLGFYSTFMVADKVEIITKSFKPESKAAKWSCKGNPEYELTETEKNERGTDVTLFISQENEEFLEDQKILELLKKYCKFLPVEIIFGTEKKSTKNDKGEDEWIDQPRIINNPKPAWVQKPTDLKEEDYKNFYHELYPYNFDEPLFNIHINVDYPFNLTGILYFPKLKNTIEVQKNKIQLYCNQVFVTDSVENIVPDFLTLLHGVIDSPDIPLNVSRSYLQSDANVKKISSHISKKVADKLEEMFKKDRADFEKKWDDIKIFIIYGMITDEKFYDRAVKFALLKNTEDKYFTIDEYKQHIEKLQTDKDKKIVHLYTSNKEEQFTYIESAKERGYDVLIMDGQLDSHFINHIERKLENTQFARVDADTIDKLIKKEENLPSKLSQKEQEDLRPVFQKQLDNKFTVVFENLSESDNPVLITQPEFLRRMRDMQKIGGNQFGYGFPEMYNVVVNINHPLIYQLHEEKEKEIGAELNQYNTQIADVKSKLDQLQKDEKSKKQNETEIETLNKELQEKENKKEEILAKFGNEQNVIKQLLDLAMLSQNLLTGESLNKFIKRSYQLLEVK